MLSESRTEREYLVTGAVVHAVLQQVLDVVRPGRISWPVDHRYNEPSFATELDASSVLQVNPVHNDSSQAQSVGENPAGLTSVAKDCMISSVAQVAL